MKKTELQQYILSNQKRNLAKVIGYHVTNVTRSFVNDLETYLEYHPNEEKKFFIKSSGSTQIFFSNGIYHTLCVEREQLSIFLSPEQLEDSKWETLYHLTDFAETLEKLYSCLGKTCEDIRIWKFNENFESEEYKEAGISYLLNNRVFSH